MVYLQSMAFLTTRLIKGIWTLWPMAGSLPLLVSTIKSQGCRLLIIDAVIAISLLRQVVNS